MLWAVGVQPCERQAVAARELDELSRRLGRMRPDDLDTDTGPRLKPLPAGVEGPQQQVTERAVFEQERSQLLTLDGDVAHRLGHDGREEDGLSREQVRLAEEAKCAVADDLRTGLVEDGRLTFDDRDQRIAQVTDPKEHVADLRAPLLAVLGKQGELSLGEPRRPGCHARTLVARADRGARETRPPGLAHETGTVVSENAACSGTSKRATPAAPVVTVPASEFSPFPVAFQSARLKRRVRRQAADAVGGSRIGGDGVQAAAVRVEPHQRELAVRPA